MAIYYNEPVEHLKWTEVDLGKIRANVRLVLSRLGKGVSLMAVVKANAYGYGAERVGVEALRAGAESLGVLTIGEGYKLRQAGIRAPIQLLSPILTRNAKDAVRLDLTPTIDSVVQAKAFSAAAGKKVVALHLDIDSGLGRWGLDPKDFPDFMVKFSRLKKVRLEGISTHIDYIPGKNAVEAEEKLSAFSRLTQRVKSENPRVIRHAANSSILSDFPHWQLDMVRIGNLIYGIDRARNKSARLQRPWLFCARIITLREVAKGSAIGYASEFIAPRRMKVATIPVGYSDGLTMEPARRLIGFGGGQRFWGMLRGRKAPFVGRVGISHTLLDVTACPRTKVGDIVLLPGRRTSTQALPRIYRG